MVQSMVEFLNGDTDYAEKKVVFKGQADYRIGRVEGDSSPRGTLREISNQPVPVLQMA